MKNFFLVTCVCFGTHVFANDAHHCSAIEGKEERLQCFDTAFPEKHDAKVDANRPNWEVSEEINKLDDSTITALFTKSNETISDRLGQQRRATLFIRCEDDLTSLYIHFPGHHMADVNGHGTVDYRVDKNSAQKVRMTASNNHEALGLWYGGVAKPFIKKIMGGKLLFVRATPYSEAPIDMTFTIAGLNETIEIISEACYW